ncbi:MAG: hypothetical protein HY718_14620 [Planctomycetes bacterium]|nr:hypothetical protein [Planctomycetota bacterium]
MNDRVTVSPKALDAWPRPFKRMVILGESTVQGGGWLSRTEERYVDILARLINDVQGEPMEYINKGIGANAISPRSPGYAQSIKPSAMERYEQDVIANHPDLFIMAYGLNDMRAGMDLKEFIEDEEKIGKDKGDILLYRKSRMSPFFAFLRSGPRKQPAGPGPVVGSLLLVRWPAWGSVHSAPGRRSEFGVPMFPGRLHHAGAVHCRANSYRPWPALRSLPWRTSSSQTARGYWFGGMMATMSDLPPLLIGPWPSRDSSSRRASLSRFLNALRALRSSSGSNACSAGGGLG